MLIGHLSGRGRWRQERDRERVQFLPIRKRVVARLTSFALYRRFQAKFHQIVASEQAANFISVLHNSQLTVIPWSVIQSKEFYTLFTKLSKLLMSQETTHASAGEFLVTLKTLMAKMKVRPMGSW